jgi:multiple sugar transport system substrate-binding protein
VTQTRRWRGFLPAALAAWIVAGCGPDPEAQGVTLRVLNWATALELESEQRIASAWAAERPGVRVLVESITTNYGEKLATGIASGSPPDVFLMDAPDVPALVDRGLVLDVAPYLSRTGYDAELVFPEVLATFRRGEQIFGLPKGFTPLVVYYNRGLFRELGVDFPPDSGWTREEFLRTARALVTRGRGRTDQDVFAVNFPRQLYEWVPFVWSGGGDILDPGGTHTAGYLDGPATVETFSFLTSLVTEHEVAPPARFLTQGDPMESARFYLGRQGMLVTGHWQLPRLMSYAERGELELGIARIPHLEGEAFETALYASAWAVPANTRHKRLAVELATWLAGAEAQRIRAAERLEIPALANVASEVAAADTTGVEAAFLAQVPHARPPWGAFVRDFHEIEEMSVEIMDRRLIRGDPLATAARDVARAIDQVIRR